MKMRDRIWLVPILIGLLFNSCVEYDKPVLTTSVVIDIAQTTATCGGNISSDGGAKIENRGVCWSTSINPTIEANITTDSSGIGIYSSVLKGLIANTTYYVRAYASNRKGTGYGDVVKFNTLGIIDSVSDIEGNVYQTITIGGQTWFAENLRTTHYRNGDTIPSVKDEIAWRDYTTGAYCNYDLDESTAITYGKLYNWYAVSDVRNLAPTGWHIPTDDEWDTLEAYLGGQSIAGGKMKETGTVHWNSPNTGATNECGFTALPGGRRIYDGTFFYIGRIGVWWSSTEISSNGVSVRTLYFNYGNVNHDVLNKNDGYSIRCVKD
jgi:uncharacterized protein (TIGR02145 family)